MYIQYKVHIEKGIGNSIDLFYPNVDIIKSCKTHFYNTQLLRKENCNDSKF